MLKMKEKTINKVVLIDVSKIVPNPAQPRLYFNESEIVTLAESISQNGLLQPITVRKTDKDAYELISGERRLRAIQHNKMEQAPCIIVDTNAKQSAVFALLENIQRSDLNYFEEALAYKALLIEWGITQQEVAQRLGVAQPTIANKLRLLKFSDQQQKVIIANGLNERQARAVLKLADRIDFECQVKYIATNKYNVAQTEKFVEKLLLTKTKAKRNIPVIKDVRIFINTINKALAVMKKSGINATAEKVEQDGYIQYVVKIPRAI